MNSDKFKSFLTGFPVIRSLSDLSEQTHISKELLYKMWKHNDTFYKSFTIPKKSGGERIISAPSKKMKAIQFWILENILIKIQTTQFATAYRRGKSIIDNANPHQANRHFLCIDLDNFFPSIKFTWVFNIFKTIGYSKHVSYILASICTYRGGLPQGGVTSPHLSNIVCIKLDLRFAGYTGKRNISYTRYADDITFSSSNPNYFPSLLPFSDKVIVEEGFKLNSDKTRILGPRQCRKITGIVISDNRIGIGKVQRKKIRACIHSYFMKNHEETTRIEMKKYYEGWLSYIKGIDSNSFKQLSEFRDKIESRVNAKKP